MTKEIALLFLSGFIGVVALNGLMSSNFIKSFLSKESVS